MHGTCLAQAPFRPDPQLRLTSLSAVRTRPNERSQLVRVISIRPIEISIHFVPKYRCRRPDSRTLRFDPWPSEVHNAEKLGIKISRSKDDLNFIRNIHSDLCQITQLADAPVDSAETKFVKFGHASLLSQSYINVVYRKRERR